MNVVYVGRNGEVYTDFPKHQHGYWEIIYNKSGYGTMFVEDDQYSFEPGDIVVIPPGILHQKHAEEGFSDVCMFIDNFRPIGKESFRIFRDDERGSVRKLMEDALYYQKDAGDYGHAVLNALGDLLYQLLVLFYINKQDKDMRLEGILELMERNVSNPDFDLSEAIDKSGYCKGYFRRIFKDFIGESPVNYFQNLRIQYAKSLMSRYGISRSVKDIATESGFKDALYFSRVFKKIEGVSPKDYLNRHVHVESSKIVMDTPEELL